MAETAPGIPETRLFESGRHGRLVCCCGAQPGAAGAIKTDLKWLNVGLLVMSQAAQDFFCVL